MNQLAASQQLPAPIAAAGARCLSVPRILHRADQEPEYASRPCAQRRRRPHRVDRRRVVVKLSSNMIAAGDPTDSHVLSFCRAIRADSAPRRVVVQAAFDAKQLDCFANVRKVVDRLSGRIVYGWAVWEWRRIYIEAEHHAIYENSGGELIDVTPPQFPHITSTLFLPDETAVYDFQNEGIRRHNHRLALSSDPLVKALFETKRAYDEIQNSIPGVGAVTTDYNTAARLRDIEARSIAISKEIAWKFTRRNDPCFCCSGKKFKKCHDTGGKI